ncbi:MerR family transcriptional regulator [Actinoplanes sp. CA-142083]|uniref:MerR family transcriptional regulator n=1 Tax=Actinoplanes sp. CA-142083 TaxID=3239903 RepID=UPI003D8A609C
MSDSPRRLITIGQLAAYAGVTIKAVRVYHDRGLLPEPPRDESGYRRYDAGHAIQLVKVKTLADAGVPLARIRELLAAGDDEFAAAITEIDDALRRRAEEIRRTRRRIAQLRAGDRLFVSPEVADYLARLRELGISDRTVGLEREIWILLQAVSPDRAAEWAADKLAAIDDPAFQSLYRDYDAAFDWQPDDPRLHDLAARTREWFAARGPEAVAAPPPDATITRLAAASVSAFSPAWTRLAELTQA